MSGGRFPGSVVVITGAASEIGVTVAERFTAEGATVVGVDRIPHAVGASSPVADLSDEYAV